MQMGGERVSDPLWFLGARAAPLHKRFSNVFTTASAVSPFRDLKTKIIIACTSRSGSTLLCQELGDYGIGIDEFFNPARARSDFRTHYSTDFNAYVTSLCRHFAPQDAFGVKGTFQIVAPLFLFGEFPAKVEEWTFVSLRRRSLVRQAISTVIAEQTDTWQSGQAGKGRADEPSYDPLAIAGAMDTIVQVNGLWDRFFAMYQIQPLHLDFEEVVRAPASTAERCATFAGLSRGSTGRAAVFGDRTIEKQSTGLNDEWEARFLRDMRRVA